MKYRNRTYLSRRIGHHVSHDSCLPTTTQLADSTCYTSLTSRNGCSCWPWKPNWWSWSAWTSISSWMTLLVLSTSFAVMPTIALPRQTAKCCRLRSQEERFSKACMIGVLAPPVIGPLPSTRAGWALEGQSVSPPRDSEIPDLFPIFRWFRSERYLGVMIFQRNSSTKTFEGSDDWPSPNPQSSTKTQANTTFKIYDRRPWLDVPTFVSFDARACFVSFSYCIWFLSWKLLNKLSEIWLWGSGSTMMIWFSGLVFRLLSMIYLIEMMWTSSFPTFM